MEQERENKVFREKLLLDADYAMSERNGMFRHLTAFVRLRFMRFPIVYVTSHRGLRAFAIVSSHQHFAKCSSLCLVDDRSFK